MKIEKIIPIKLPSPNLQEHWRKKHKRNKIYEIIIKKEIGEEIKKIKLPCIIKLTRISPRKLDYDNLCFAFKKISDIICDMLIPNLQPGRADGDARIRIEYAQENGNPKEYAIKIAIVAYREN